MKSRSTKVRVESANTQTQPNFLVRNSLKLRAASTTARTQVKMKKLPKTPTKEFSIDFSKMTRTAFSPKKSHFTAETEDTKLLTLEAFYPTVETLPRLPSKDTEWSKPFTPEVERFQTKLQIKHTLEVEPAFKADSTKLIKTIKRKISLRRGESLPKKKKLIQIEPKLSKPSEKFIFGDSPFQNQTDKHKIVIEKYLSER